MCSTLNVIKGSINSHTTREHNASTSIQSHFIIVYQSLNGAVRTAHFPNIVNEIESNFERIFGARFDFRIISNECISIHIGDGTTSVLFR